MKLSYKIFLYFGTFTLLTILIFFSINYFVIERSLHERARGDLRILVETTHTAVEKMLDTAIRNYLRSIVEQNLTVLNRLQNRVLNKEITVTQAKDFFQEQVLEQTIGESGYIVALRADYPQIFLDIHPFQRGNDCATNQGCQDWISQKNGYSEYEWQNPNDNRMRKKVGYISQFKPWNWVVGATSYKDEFTQLINIEDLRRLFNSITILDQGYFILIDESLTFLIHPELIGQAGYEMQNVDGEFIARELINNLDDFYYYRWQNPSQNEPSQKFAYTKKLDNFNWYLVATGYMDDVTRPINNVMRISYILACVAAILLTGLTLLFSRRLSSPLEELIQGVNDFYHKKKIFRMTHKSVSEVNAVGHALEKMTKTLVISEREKIDLLDQLNSIINSMPSILMCVDTRDNVILWNEKAAVYAGFTGKHATGKPLSDVVTDHEILKHIKNGILLKAHFTETCQVQQIDKSVIHYEITVYPLHTGRQSAVILIDDITERIQMEDILLQSRKMEAIGTLAGGIAHDFNNILSAVFGYTELIQQDLPPESQAYDNLNQVIKASHRAKDLVQQILLFSRQTKQELKPIQPHLIIREAIKLLRSTIPTTIEIRQDIPSDSGAILADPTQLHQIVMNICTNAYHAMRNTGGILTLKLSGIFLWKEDIMMADIELEPGEYLKLDISDTGHGMTKEIQDNIFNPYFTTKPKGEGVGLGLPVVLGIIKSYGGTIKVYSEPGEGTCITIFFKSVETENKVITENPNHSVPKGDEHILVVDDEESISDMMKKTLESLHYQVSSFINSEKAYLAFSSDPDKFDLVITDMTMPHMTGLQFAKKIMMIRPEIPIILCTGYSELVTKEKALAEGIRSFLSKPVLRTDLARSIREVLDKNTT